MSTTDIFNIISGASLFLGISGMVYAGLRGSVYKQNHVTDQATIKSKQERLDEALESLRDEKERADKLEGENKILNDTVTAAPLIAQLAAQTSKQHASTVKWQKQTVKLQKDMIIEFKNFVESHDSGVPS